MDAVFFSLHFTERHVVSICLITGGINVDLLVKFVVSALSLHCKVIFPIVMNKCFVGRHLGDHTKSHSSPHIPHPLILASIDVSFKS